MTLPGYFITGTDTGVGKSVATAALIRLLVSEGKQVAGLKPIASGFEMREGVYQNDDVQMIQAAANVTLPLAQINRYGFRPPIAPHIAAQAEGVSIDCNAIKADLDASLVRADVTVVEGVGGWMVPLDHQDTGCTIERLAQVLGLPVILVVGLRLGCLNHALLTADAVRRSGLPLAGWVANHLDPNFSNSHDNISALQQRIPAPKLFELEYSPRDYQTLSPTKLHPVISTMSR